MSCGILTKRGYRFSLGKGITGMNLALHHAIVKWSSGVTNGNTRHDISNHMIDTVIDSYL